MGLSEKMNLNYLVQFTPQTAAISSGPEPSLEDIVLGYYLGTGLFSVTEAKKCTKEYFAKLTEHFGE